jgi:hypothetical protein
MLGRPQVQDMVNTLKSCKQYDIVVGFDLVNEEDFCDPIDTFLD